MWWIGVIVFVAVVAVLALAAILLRSAHRSRARWLMGNGLTLDAASFEQRAREFRCVVAVDFGFGREFWATHRGQPRVRGEAMGRVIADGYCILGRAAWSEMEARCQRLGVPLIWMMSVDQGSS